MLFQAQTHVILNLRNSHSFSGMEINDQCLTHRNVCILVQFLAFCKNFKLTSNSWYKLLKPALILSREYFFLTINLGNRCKTKRLYSLVKNGLRKQNTGTPDVITPRPLNWFGCHRFHTSSTKIYEIQFYYSDLNVVNCYE